MNHLHRTYGPALSDIFSGDVFHSLSGSPTDTCRVLNEAVDDANVRNKTQSTKTKIQKFKNGDFTISYNASFEQIRTDLRALFSMRRRGATDYVTYDVPNGRMAFRIADHNANGNNFEQDEADTNISVYVKFREFNVPASKIPFTEFKIERETFDTKRQEVIHAIIDAVSSALEGGEFSIPKELADRKDYPLPESYNPSISSKHIVESRKPLTNVEIIRKMMAFDFD